MVAIMRSSVVFPAPSEPRTPMVSPLAMPNRQGATAVKAPKRFEASSTRT